MNIQNTSKDTLFIIMFILRYIESLYLDHENLFLMKGELLIPDLSYLSIRVV